MNKAGNLKKILIFLLIFILIKKSTWGQFSEVLSIHAEKMKLNNSCSVYEIEIKNNSDSVALILHSMFMDLTSKNPQGLALYEKNTPAESYSFDYAFQDTIYDVESQAYRSEFVMPYQTLRFKITINSSNGKRKLLSFKYFFINDFCYRNLRNEMREMTTWYLKYEILKKNIELPFN